MKVGWFVVGQKTQPSTRIMALNVIRYLNEKNICENSILWQPPEFTPVVPTDVRLVKNLDYVVFQKACMGDALEQLLWYKHQGTKTIYILDDFLLEAADMVKNADIIISGSQYLSEMIKHFFDRDSRVMIDAYETPPTLFKEDYTTDKIRVVWFGTVGHFNEALDIKPITEELGYDFITISSCPEATKIWSYDTIWSDIISSDIVVIPFLGELPPFELAKGNNRLTQSMVLGMPVVASPIPAYFSIVDQYRNGIITFNNDKEDWKEALSYLRSPEVRREIGTRAHNAVVFKYHISTIGGYWKEILYGKS